MTATIQQTIDELRRSLTEYLEATYHIGNAGIVGQRRKLLEETGGIFQKPYLESTPRYVTGARYEDMADLPQAAREALVELASSQNGKPVIFNPPYRHQADALRESLSNQRNLMIMTGTGSGKTESFLLPILGKLAVEARNRPEQFRDHHAVRAMVLYPMNALVNDQLGRLRLLFGNPRVIGMFERWAGRSALFARYTSRTPYAGVRSPKKDGKRLSSVGDFFAAIENAAGRHNAGQPYVPEEDSKAASLFDKLFRKGKWPAKESVSAWFGAPNTVWRDRNGQYRRAVTMPHDAELLTRHEVQASPPDLLITNYSMLEYMMMRPIERTIFDRTKAWLEACPTERFTIVLDEAHLYRGAQGAEVGLLLRRLRERLGIGPERFQVICATASFSAQGRQTAGHFGAQLSGVPEGTFTPITGELALRTPTGTGTPAEAALLASVDLRKFYEADPAHQAEAILPFLRARGAAPQDDLGVALYGALADYAPLNLLINESMKSAVPLAELSGIVFPGTPQDAADTAIAVLLALGSRARLSAGDASLLPCRIHSFFRGLPGLWVCMDPNCTAMPPEERGGPTGKLYAQPRERCSCGSPVLEYFTCRRCGTSYARAYTTDVTNPRYIWANPGEYIETGAGVFEPLHALDLLLENPSRPERGRAADYDLRTGRINPENLGDRSRIVYLRPEHVIMDDDDEEARAKPGEFAPCGCCNKTHMFGQTTVQDHQTKGDQPFQALLSTQIRIQPPGPQPATEFAPLRGRKILVFSDSRQVAARLAPTLQSYSLKDTIRALLPVGFRMLMQDPLIGPAISLNNAFLAVLIAAHRFGVRVRPEFEQGESMPVLTGTQAGQLPSGAELFRLMNAPCPVNLLTGIVDAIRDNGLGLEPLAIASLCEGPALTAQVTALPNLPGLAETPEAKLAVARAWLRSWARTANVWFAGMPPHWWASEVRSHRSGEFKAMERVITGRDAKRVFKREWLPRLLAAFTERLTDGGMRLLAQHLSLAIGGEWQRCTTCRSVHRPIPNVTRCIDCGESTIELFDPNQDSVFKARRGFYRDPAAHALEQSEPNFLSLIAAEHTAQLNAAQPEDVFSEAEKHEARFQDIDLAWRAYDTREPAIDVLSSTTTMEVGIDIGELSGVALRNMPPARANYQQRAGRAGRRGTAVATVVAFGSSDSHDDHYFVAPDEMIRGEVADPRLTLENPDIARRHLRAFLLQRYHEARIPEINPDDDPNLFSVLGSVRDFRLGTGVLHREDFRQWLTDNRDDLEEAVDRWLPTELSASDRAALITLMIEDSVCEVDKAIGYTGPESVAESDPPPVMQTEETDADADDDDDDDDDEQPDDETEVVDPAADKLLDRLLYWGVLPRYAFPTDVASFYVFNVSQSTPFAPKMEFAPSQGLNVALSQYAPNKQIWIKGKQYTSKAIFSPYRNDRRDSWGRRKLYFECSRCGHAKTEEFVQARQNMVVACEACRAPDAFGPAKPWFRPPGFAHPIDKQPVTTPDAPNETAYATRAKLIMSTPAPDTGWVETRTRIRAFPTREKLLVSNSGPENDGYNYCVACGRIETATDPEIILSQPHSRPYPTDEEGLCPGRVSPHVVLGTDFITDIALFSLALDEPFCVFPGHDETASALRTVCEAVAKAAGRLLQIESGEILAEYRPALTDAGAIGKEVEIFVYDTLAGGAGFSPQLAHSAKELFETALQILEECPADCDSSCYRCLRSFRNKIEHRLLDRKLGAQFLKHALYGGYQSYPEDRLHSSTEILFHDLVRQSPDFAIEMSARRRFGETSVMVPIVMRRRDGGQEIWVALNSPIAPNVPDDPTVEIAAQQHGASFVCVDDLLVRKNLPAAVRDVCGLMR
ncbi:DUF1998 domain-containing protein [Bradyrhizobium japonicum]|uniref:DEAD/DEAH box helicase n=1 Tax=Bradyrhizobium japonicum TaxID=375 RepID=UPI001BA8DDBF|nr:DEAD/DEAH box helicase [Bradyrhizobium japonicum]MBR0749136.1 DUF1998 domain-containing protein [Bradyrhizobium japonicum]